LKQTAYVNQWFIATQCSNTGTSSSKCLTSTDKNEHSNSQHRLQQLFW